MASTALSTVPKPVMMMKDASTPAFAQFSQHVDAGESRHPHVREDDVESAGLRHLERLLAGAGNLHRVAGRAEHAGGALPHALIVVYEENPRHERR